MQARRTVPAGALLAAVLLVGGCGGGGQAPSDLRQALGSVGAGPASSVLEWSDPAAIVKLAGGSTDDALGVNHWALVYGVGLLPTYDRDPPRLRSRLGIDLHRVTSATAIGSHALTANRIEGPGVDGGRLRDLVTRLGASRDGSRFTLTTAASRRRSVLGAVTSDGNLAAFDHTAIASHVFASSRYDAPVRELAGEGPKLGALPSYRAVESCLGDVLWTGIASGTAAGVPVSRLVAVGGHRPSSATAAVTEVLCAVDPSRQSAVAQLRRVRQTLSQSATLAFTHQRVAREVRPARFDTLDVDGEHVVRVTLTLRPNASPGFTETLLTSGALPSLLGSGQ